MRSPRSTMLAAIVALTVSPAATLGRVGWGGGARSQAAGAVTSRTVWEAVYSEVQAKRGEVAYAQGCASCHADDLKGSATAPPLAGEEFLALWRGRSVGDLLDQIRTLMPPDRPGTLPGAVYRDIVAFVLRSNDYPAGAKELEADVSALRRIMITAKPAK